MMRFVLPERTLIKRMAACAAVLLVLGWVGDAQAQWSTKWLAVGELHHPYLSGGAEPENLVDQWNWPGIRPGVAYNHWKGLWVSAENWTGPDGQNWEVKTSHIGPRILGIGEVFDLQHLMIARFKPPVVTVDGNITFHRPVTVEEVDETLDPARMVHSVINTSVGVQVEKRAMQFSNEFHDNYHIIEYIFTNTGNIDEDEEIELPDQTLEGVFFTFLDRPKANAASGAWDNSSGGMAWGQHVMNDANWPGGPMDYGVDFRAQWSWIGAIPGKSDVYNTLGNPMWFNHRWNAVPDDTLGRLGSAAMSGQVVLHADEISHAPPANGYDAIFNTESTPDHVQYGVQDNPDQPHTMTYIESDWSDITTGNDHTNLSKMLFERDLIERGAKGNPINIAPPEENPRTWPTHAYLVEPTGNFVNQSADPSLGRAGGWGYMNAYGPYNIPPGEQVKIVLAEGVAGLSDLAAYQIGRTYKLSGADDSLPIAFDADNNGTIEDDERLTKNEWALTARDSLFQMFDRALANFEAGYDIPTAPMPPSEFHVTSGIDQISLTWDVYPEAGDPPNGWRLFRAQKNYWGIVTALEVGPGGLAVPDSARAYNLIAELPGSARSYDDTDVERGSQYFYYIVAVGDVNTDAAGNTPTGVPLVSNRYYSQTYEPAVLKRAPAESLSEVRVVPNPYNLQASTEVRFDVEEQLAFFGLPGIATIKIYTELGELIETIDHSDLSGDETWNLTTSSRQPVVSGVYIAVIENQDPDSPSFGEQVIRKFIIIR